ncbi:MAG: 16S rRNA (adenine(1518)-N(6)/adenine(1519)-N(6))-dimethyltransferase RsmA [Parasporobacterium sp.]|nr:16S rRNA (adenine(1518)-N(6)/adenine(1519)-N(6))-dimethyltransferase RsmA [Parasporobacterium sp.]
MSDLGNPRIIQELIREHHFAVQKKYGQNFLVDSNILEGIVSAAGITKEDTVLEIGPGMGSLTQYLLESAGRVIAVEVDKMLIPILKENLKDYSNLTLIHGDILKLDLSEVLAGEEGKRIKVVANLPYYITTPIVMELLEKQEDLESITVMVQKEVAQRMQEGPGSKSYGALSLAVQYYSKPQIVMTVSKHCFLPKPDVDSAVIRLDIYRPEERPVRSDDPAFLFRVIRAAFNQRRKTLVNSLSNDPAIKIPKEKTIQALQSMGKPETIRGEALTLSEFAELSALLI